MAVTEASIRERVRALLFSAQPTARPYVDVLGGNLAAGGTSVDVGDGASWSKGDIMDFDDGDQAVVTAIATNTLTLRRLSGATAHASGDLVERNPRFSTKQIDYALDHIIQDLYPDVYLITTVQLVYAATTQWYSINNDDLQEILTVYYEDDDYLTPVPVPAWRQASGVDPTEFTQKQGVFLPSSSGMDEGDNFYVTFRERITAVTDLLDRQEPLVAQGAAHQLLAAHVSPRTNDPGRWTDRTVQPGQDGRDALNYLREYLTMRRREELRLMHDEDRLPKNRRAERARRYRV